MVQNSPQAALAVLACFRDSGCCNYGVCKNGELYIYVVVNFKVFQIGCFHMRVVQKGLYKRGLYKRGVVYIGWVHK